MKKPWMPIEIQISLLYLLFGGLWILFSDLILESLVQDVRELTRLQNYKGWFYVAASGSLIYILLRGYVSKVKKTQTKLAESEERLLLAISISNQGIFDLDIPTGKIMLNQTSFEQENDLVEYESTTLDTFLSQIHPEDREFIDRLLLECMDGKKSKYNVEFRYKPGTGKWKWFFLTGSVVEKDSKGQPKRMLGIYMDITDKKNDELIRIRLLDDAQRRLERITTLHEIDLEISSSSDLSTTLDKIVLNIKKHLEVDAVSILLSDEENSSFTFADGIGFATERIKNARVKMGGSFAGVAAQKRKLIHIHDLKADNVDEAFGSLLKEEKIVNYLGIPLLSKGNLVGVLELFVKEDIYPDSEWLEFCETLAGQAALAIENARLIDGLGFANQDLSRVNLDLVAANENLTAAYDATIESLALALNLRDYETEDHSRRVTTMMMDLAKMMDFSAEDLVNIHRGTLLHDIGKLGVPDSILRKPGILTDEERKIMQQHPVYAYNLLKSIEYLQPALDIPHLHHEKWDGTGYPYGLAGRNIPLSARLFAIVDVYDALTSDRPYRKAWTKEVTIAFLKEQKGIHFDPQVVEIFMEYLAKYEVQ